MHSSGPVFFLFWEHTLDSPTHGFSKSQYFSPFCLQTVFLLLGEHLENDLTGVKTPSRVLLSCENTFNAFEFPISMSPSNHLPQASNVLLYVLCICLPGVEMEPAGLPQLIAISVWEGLISWNDDWNLIALSNLPSIRYKKFCWDFLNVEVKDNREGSCLSH